ncbi:MAG TPA: pseudouridine synthase [Cytophagales bacterium]|nr:pseudouridine synthase [Cytophagales bacterium]
MLEIVYQDEYLVAINKPHGLLVHRTHIAADVEIFALQLLRDQLGQKVYPIHRLDRKTSGVLLFALNEDSEVAFKKLMEARGYEKSYLAIVRGHTKAGDTIDYPLKNERGNSKEAVTIYKTIEHTEIPLPFGKHATSRYSLVEAKPITGRMHQLRRHFAHILHPIIGDRPYGCNKQNKLFLEHFHMSNMMLHARSVKFMHPYTQHDVYIKAPLSPVFLEMISQLEFDFEASIL